MPLLRVDEALAAQFQGPDLGVVEAFDGPRTLAYFAAIPHLVELRRLGEEQFDQVRGVRMLAAEGGDLVQADTQGRVRNARTSAA